MTNQQRQQAGFSLPELMITSSVLLGLITVSAGSYSGYLKHQTLRSATIEAQHWIEDVSRIAEQHNTSCVIEAFSSGLLQEAANNPASCVIPEGIQLDASVSGEVDEDNKILIAFTPKATSAEGQELLLSIDGLDTRRCILVSRPLGLIRNGLKTASGTCDYNKTIAF